MTTTSLTENAIYALPDGTEVIATESEMGGWVLYTRAEWDAADTADYEVQKDGAVTLQGEPTGWTASDLVATGDTVGA